MAEKAGETVGVHVEDILTRQVEQCGTWLKLRERLYGLGMDIVGTDGLAGVAPIEAVAKAGSNGEGAAMFDSEIAQAAACVNLRPSG